MRLVRLLIACALVAQVAPASAGVASDALGKCLVAKSTEADKAAFMRWFLASLSSAPAVKDVAPVTAERQAEIEKEVADHYVRLLTADCHDQAVAAIRQDGPNALKGTFGVLGQAAVRNLVNDPAVSAGVGHFGQYVDEAKIDALEKEAGASAGAAAKKPEEGR